VSGQGVNLLKILTLAAHLRRESNKWVNIRATDPRVRANRRRAIELIGEQCAAQSCQQNGRNVVTRVRPTAKRRSRDQWRVTALGSLKVRRRYNGRTVEKGRCAPLRA